MTATSEPYDLALVRAAASVIDEIRAEFPFPHPDRLLASELPPGCAIKIPGREGFVGYDGLDEHGDMLLVDVSGARWTHRPEPRQTFVWWDGIGPAA